MMVQQEGWIEAYGRSGVVEIELHGVGDSFYLLVGGPNFSVWFAVDDEAEVLAEIAEFVGGGAESLVMGRVADTPIRIVRRDDRLIIDVAGDDKQLGYWSIYLSSEQTNDFFSALSKCLKDYEEEP